MSDIESKVIGIVRKELGDFMRPGVEITMASQLWNDLNMDSLDGVEIVMECEKVFNVDLPDEDLEGVRTVGDLIRVVQDSVQRSGR